MFYSIIFQCFSLHTYLHVFYSVLKYKNVLEYHEVNEEKENSRIFLKASYDCVWQKRGTGHAYDSLSSMLFFFNCMLLYVIVCYFFLNRCFT